jgi:hypothetical protein
MTDIRQSPSGPFLGAIQGAALQTLAFNAGPIVAGTYDLTFAPATFTGFVSAAAILTVTNTDLTDGSASLTWRRGGSTISSIQVSMLTGSNQVPLSNGSGFAVTAGDVITLRLSLSRNSNIITSAASVLFVA